MTTSIPDQHLSDADEATQRMLAVVHRLAADEYSGRRVGTAGGRAAADWLTALLRDLGADVETSEFPVVGAVRELSATPVLRLTGGGGSVEFVHRRGVL